MMKESSEGGGGGDPFPKTSVTMWKKIASTGNEDAMEEFCRTYWYPMYAFLRMRKKSHPDACDLVQGFIADELLGRGQLREWDSKKGRLRTFLKVSLDRYSLKEFRKETTQKRGGVKSKTHLSLDFEWAEGHYKNSAIDFESPDKLYEKEWAESVVKKTLNLVQDQYKEQNKSKEFELLCRNLSSKTGDEDDIKFREIGKILGIKEGNVKQRMREFRAEFKAALYSVVKETTHPGEVEDEVNFIFNLMTGQ